MAHNPILPHATLAVAALTSVCLQAAEWSAEPSITVRGEYNDNIRMTRAPHDSVWGAIVDPKLTLARRTELWDLDLTGRVRAAGYDGESGLNTVDSYFYLDSRRRMERGAFEANVSLINDTTLQNEVIDLDTGLVVNQIDRTQKYARLLGSFLFTESTWLEASVDYTKVAYDDGAIYGLLDYDYYTPSLRIVHQYSPKTQLFGTLAHTRVDYVSSTELESKTDSLQLGGSYEISEVWKFTASVGTRRTRTSRQELVLIPLFGFFYTFQVVPREDETTGLIYNVNLSRKLETGDLKFTAIRSITPSSTGTDTEATRLEFSGNHHFTTQFSAGLAVSYLQSTTISGATTQADTDRYRVEPSLTWLLDRDLTLKTAYTYNRVKREIENDTKVDGNAVYVSLGYSWPRMATSR